MATHAQTVRPRRQLSLKPFNSFGIDATARVVYTLEHIGQLDALLQALQQDLASMPADTAAARRPLILGGGSNLLLARNLHEPVLLVRHRGRAIVGQTGSHVLVDVAAGESWHDTVRWSLAQGCFGLENLALIPGRAGAAPWQNIGAYGAEAGQFIESVEAINLCSGECRRFSQRECSFAYRHSFFKTPAGRDWLVLSVRLQLSRHFEPRLGYSELATALQQRTATSGQPLDALLVADTVEQIRRRKLPDPAQLGNAGSFFHNPVVDGEMAGQLRLHHPGLPCHPAGPGQYKLSAGWLIDACGWKGYREGDAGVSPDHALVLVNHGQASGAALLQLAQRIRQSVFERFGVWLQPEPLILQ